MTKYHWGGMLLLFAVGYFVGVMFPTTGLKVKASVGL